MRRPALRFTAVAAVAAATALTACGSSNGNIPKNADPRTEFVTALENLGHSDALTSTLRFHATADQLVAFDKAVETSASDVMTPDAAAKLASGSVSFAVKTTDGKDISDRSKNRKANVRATLVDGGKTYVDFRVVDAALYLQVQLKQLLALGGSSKEYDNVKAQTAQMPAFVKAFVNGEWVSIDTATVKTLTQELGGAAGVQQPNAATQQKFLAALKADLSRDVTVKKVGSDEKGDHLVLTGSSRKLAKDVVSAFSSVEPALGSKIKPGDVNSVGDHTITVDAWVKDGIVSVLQLDVAQFAPAGKAAGQHVPIELSFDQSADDISKPSGATPVDVSQLFSMFGALGKS